MGYSFWLTARVLWYAPSHRQDNTYHSLCYTSCGALAGTRNSSHNLRGTLDILWVYMLVGSNSLSGMVIFSYLGILPSVKWGGATTYIDQWSTNGVTNIMVSQKQEIFPLASTLLHAPYQCFWYTCHALAGMTHNTMDSLTGINPKFRALPLRYIPQY